MFTPHTDHRIEYISLYDEAVDDDALTIEQVEKYTRTRDTSLLPFKAAGQPIIWTLAPLDRYTLKYALSTCPGAVEGGLIPEILAYHLCQVGIKGAHVEGEVEGKAAKLPPPRAPHFSLHREGLLEKVDPGFVRAIPPEVAQEIGGVIYDLSTVSEETKKKPSSPSDGKKSKKRSPAKPARRK